MTTPAEVGAGKKAFDWIKNGATYVFKLAKRIATLEERVTELENALKKQPADAQMLPAATLRAEYHVTNPRKLIGFRIIVDGKTVAIVSRDEMIKAVLESGLATEFETPDRRRARRRRADPPAAR